MSEEESTSQEIKKASAPTPSMDFEAVYASGLKDRRELSEDELKTAGELIDTARQMLYLGKLDKNNSKVAYVMTQKFIGDPSQRKVDPKGNRFYVEVKNFNATDPFADQSRSLHVRFLRTDPDSVVLEEDGWTLPLSKGFIGRDNGLYIRSLERKSTDWGTVREMVQDLRSNLRVYGQKMAISEEVFKAVEDKPRPVG